MLSSSAPALPHPFRMRLGLKHYVRAKSLLQAHKSSYGNSKMVKRSGNITYGTKKWFHFTEKEFSQDVVHLWNGTRVAFCSLASSAGSKAHYQHPAHEPFPFRALKEDCYHIFHHKSINPFIYIFIQIKSKPRYSGVPLWSCWCTALIVPTLTHWFA